MPIVPIRATLVGRTVACPYPCGGTWTIEALEIRDGEIHATTRWDSTTADSLNGTTSVGTLAPGTALWDALASDQAALEDISES